MYLVGYISHSYWPSNHCKNSVVAFKEKTVWYAFQAKFPRPIMTFWWLPSKFYLRSVFHCQRGFTVYQYYVSNTGLVQNLEEETRVNTYLVKDKLPNEIASKKKSVNELQRVVSEPAMGQSDLDAITQKVCVNAR